MGGAGVALARWMRQEMECPDCGAAVELQETEERTQLVCSEECGAPEVYVG